MVSRSPALQTHLMDVAADAQTLAAASNHAAFNVANALGPWLGGLAITAGFGWTSTGYIGAATAVGGLLVFAWAWKIERAVREAEAEPAACCSWVRRRRSDDRHPGAQHAVISEARGRLADHSASGSYS
jgi:DHA1 family inner membrane transport protein